MRRLFVVAALALTSSVARAQAQAQAVGVTLSEWKVRLEHDTVRTGTVTFKVKNAGTVTHGFYIRGDGVDEGSQEIPPGQSATLTVKLKAGSYDVFCPMSDLTHKAAGMSRTLVVIAGGTPDVPRKPGG